MKPDKSKFAEEMLSLLGVPGSLGDLPPVAAINDCGYKYAFCQEERADRFIARPR